MVVKNHEGFIVSRNGDLLRYMQGDTKITERHYNETLHAQRFTQTGTYSVVLMANNAGGTLTATYSYVV